MTQGTVDDVVARMREIGAGLEPGDGVGEFNAMYLVVTELVRDRVNDGFFADPEFMARFDVVFAELYFTAYDVAAAAQPPSKAWAPIFEARADRGVLPVQFAMAGMNAHINHDLPQAVVTTCQEFGVEPDEGTVFEDYLRVNQLLAAAESEVRRSFLSEAGQVVDDRIGWVVHLVSSWSIERARDAAWASALTLWALRRTRVIRNEYLAAHSRTVGLAGRLLVTPAPSGPR
jgi:hypothetical protein